MYLEKKSVIQILLTQIGCVGISSSNHSV